MAVGNDHFDIVKQISDQIEDKHPQDCKGFSPFKLAVYQINLEMIKFLEETCGIYDEGCKEEMVPGFERSKKPRLEFEWKKRTKYLICDILAVMIILSWDK